MKKFYYLYICIPFLALLFSNSVYAATSGISASGTDQNGNTFQVTANTYTNIGYDEIFENEIIGNIQYTYKWNLAQNVTIKGLKTGQYYNGRVIITITDNPTSPTIRNRVYLASSSIEQGLYAFLDAVTTNTYRVCIIFDNWYATDSTVGLPSIITEYNQNNTQNFSSLSINTNTSVAITYSNGFTPTTSPMLSGFADVLSAMIGWSINSAQEFDDIINLLNVIKNQDYVYYTQLTSQMSSILTNQANIYQSILDVIDEVDADFQDVQTILDLFPSYRTQVLAYWQQLLQMNSEQSSKAAELESEAQNREDKSNDLLTGLDDIELPSINSGDLDIFSGTDNTVKTNFFGLIGIITHQSLITKLFLIVVVAGITGYAIYGKRG